MNSFDYPEVEEYNGAYTDCNYILPSYQSAFGGKQTEQQYYNQYFDENNGIQQESPLEYDQRRTIENLKKQIEELNELEYSQKCTIENLRKQIEEINSMMENQNKSLEECNELIKIYENLVKIRKNKTKNVLSDFEKAIEKNELKKIPVGIVNNKRRPVESYKQIELKKKSNCIIVLFEIIEKSEILTFYISKTRVDCFARRIAEIKSKFGRTKTRIVFVWRNVRNEIDLNKCSIVYPTLVRNGNVLKISKTTKFNREKFFSIIFSCIENYNCNV